MAWVSDGRAPSVLSFAATKVQRLNTWHPCLILSNRTVSVINKISLYIGACSLSLLLGAANTTTFGLFPGPRLVGTRADSSGGGSVTATLQGSELTLKGSFSGLLAVPTGAQLCMGPLPGVRGPRVADLTISPATSGALSGNVQLNSAQQAALRKGGLYVEIDSSKAPDGDLWGWIILQ